jgi:hypothetical protein
VRVSKGARERDTVSYQWLLRPDGSVVRQLKPGSRRAVRQLVYKGKGKNRVHAG